jgi:hypothetical protein
VPDGVCVVWTGFLPEPLEVVCGRPRLTIVVTCGDRGAPHVRATHIPVLSIVVASRCHGPLKALLAPLFATLDALPLWGETSDGAPSPLLRVTSLLLWVRRGTIAS